MRVTGIEEISFSNIGITEAYLVGEHISLHSNSNDMVRSALFQCDLAKRADETGCCQSATMDTFCLK